MRKLHTLEDAVKEYGRVVGICECGCNTEMCKQNTFLKKQRKKSTGKVYETFQTRHRRFLLGHDKKSKKVNAMRSYRNKGKPVQNREFLNNVKRDKEGRFE